MTSTYPTAIIEADSLVREGLRLILDNTPFSPLVCAADSGTITDIDAQALFIFVVREKETAVRMIAELRQRFPNAKLVAIADESHSDSLALALETGANAAFFTGITPDGLVNSLRALVVDDLLVVDARIWSGGHPPSANAEGQSPQTARGPQGLQLSTRESDILNRIALGDSNKHIARHFDIAEATVKAHMKAILRKIGAVNRTQAAIWAVNNGFDRADAAEDAAAPDAESPDQHSLPAPTLPAASQTTSRSTAAGTARIAYY